MLTLTAKQFAWTYLILNGQAGVKPGYFGGTELANPRVEHLYGRQSLDGEDRKIRQHFLKEIRSSGVNWERTKEPFSNQISVFSDTNSPCDIKEVLVGELVLNNGLCQTWSSEPLCTSNAFELMAEVDRLKSQFVDIFG